MLYPSHPNLCSHCSVLHSPVSSLFPHSLLHSVLFNLHTPQSTHDVLPSIPNFLMSCSTFDTMCSKINTVGTPSSIHSILCSPLSSLHTPCFIVHNLFSITHTLFTTFSLTYAMFATQNIVPMLYASFYILYSLSFILSHPFRFPLYTDCTSFCIVYSWHIILSSPCSLLRFHSLHTVLCSHIPFSMLYITYLLIHSPCSLLHYHFLATHCSYTLSFILSTLASISPAAFTVLSPLFPILTSDSALHCAQYHCCTSWCGYCIPGIL